MKEKDLTSLCLISMCTYNFLLHHSYKGSEFASLAGSSLKVASIQSPLPLENPLANFMSLDT